mgnify:CR=1 FL=1
MNKTGFPLIVTMVLAENPANNLYFQSFGISFGRKPWKKLVELVQNLQKLVKTMKQKLVKLVFSINLANAGWLAH